MTFLLDVNVLVALFDPAHLHHDLVHAWYTRQKLHRKAGNHMATCPITENGLIRVLTNPAYPNAQLLPGQASGLLARFLQQHPNHIFLPADVSLTDADLFHVASIQGHGQLTDLYLLGLCHRHGVRLATLDRRIGVDGVVGAERERIECIVKRPKE